MILIKIRYKWFLLNNMLKKIMLFFFVINFLSLLLFPFFFSFFPHLLCIFLSYICLCFSFLPFFLPYFPFAFFIPFLFFLSLPWFFLLPFLFLPQLLSRGQTHRMERCFARNNFGQSDSRKWPLTFLRYITRKEGSENMTLTMHIEGKGGRERQHAS